VLSLQPSNSLISDSPALEIEAISTERPINNSLPRYRVQYALQMI